MFQCFILTRNHGFSVSALNSLHCCHTVALVDMKGIRPA